MALLSKFLYTLLAIAVSLVALRVQRVLRYKRNKPIRHGRRNPHEPTHLMVVLGSGGHTAEMISMLERSVTHEDPAQRLDWKDYTHRTWVVSSGDSISATRAKDFEEMASALTTQETLMAGKVRKSTDRGDGTYDIVTIPRAREIHQPLVTAPLSSLKCAQACWVILTKYSAEKNKEGRDAPDIILCNGPATATIMALVSVVLRFFNTQGCGTRGRLRIIYVESWARVKKLSLSGIILKNLVDRFIVQWPQLEKSAGSKAEYIGALI
ncbi:glycosyltransferase family 1 protein [Polychaeton citri CBS 116435]|uniref:UDP-N-acetylglucosamine transferase subunit ALG14 n=1 Tax=Polychaeton citri CBS 116435 TaxID=1314669 RepID=A0A9P4Q119_9PEZI|nr:glycosyltransferase family 1 protein [Polychaeton citri CBS 116435]